MRMELYQGIILLIIGMSLVFICLSILTLCVYAIRKLSGKKDIVINIPTPIRNDMQNLERIAVIGAALMYMQTRHSSLTNSQRSLKQDENLKFFNWLGK